MTASDDRMQLEQATGQLFGDLWGSYDAELFEESVQLFFKRLHLNRSTEATVVFVKRHLGAAT